MTKSGSIFDYFNNMDPKHKTGLGTALGGATLAALATSLRTPKGDRKKDTALKVIRNALIGGTLGAAAGYGIPWGASTLSQEKDKKPGQNMSEPYTYDNRPNARIIQEAQDRVKELHGKFTELEAKPSNVLRGAGIGAGTGAVGETLMASLRRRAGVRAYKSMVAKGVDPASISPVKAHTPNLLRGGVVGVGIGAGVGYGVDRYNAHIMQNIADEIARTAHQYQNVSPFLKAVYDQINSR